MHNESFPEEIAKTASSLLLECGHRFHRADIIEAFLEEFEAAYEVYLKTEDMEGLQPCYNELLVNMNRHVRVLDPKEPFEGKAMGNYQKKENSRRHMGTAQTGVFRRGFRERNIRICLKKLRCVYPMHTRKSST